MFQASQGKIPKELLSPLKPGASAATRTRSNKSVEDLQVTKATPTIQKPVPPSTGGPTIGYSPAKRAMTARNPKREDT